MSIDYDKLKNEIIIDPSGLGYLGKTDEQIMNLLNAINLPVQRESISGAELFGLTDTTEYAALTAELKNQWIGICGIDKVTKSAVTIIKSIFAGNTATWASILSAAKNDISRASQLGFSEIRMGEVTDARAK